MADYEKLRKKREAESMARLEIERQERRIKEEQQRNERKRELEKRQWDAMSLNKRKEQQEQDLAETARRNAEIAKLLEQKKNRTESERT